MARIISSYLTSLCLHTFLCTGIAIIAVHNAPTAFFLVSSLILFVFCMSILVPVFLPKYRHRDVKEPRGRAGSIVVIDRNKNPRSSLSQWRPDSNESGPQSSDEGLLEGSSSTHTARTRKSGNVAAFFASRPQPVVRTSGTLGAGSAHSRGSGLRGSGVRGSNRGSQINGLHCNTGGRRGSNPRHSPIRGSG